MAKYYTRITLKRMAELLDLPVEVSIIQILISNKNGRTDRAALTKD